MASPTQYEQLKASNDAREKRLQARGIMADHSDLYPTLLLESILGHIGGEQAIEDAREVFELKRQERIEAVEKQIAKGALVKIDRPHGSG